MSIQLNHTIVPAVDPRASAAFLAEILGLGAPVRYGPFHVLQIDNGISLEFMRVDRDIHWQHYAFIIARPYGSAS